MELCEIISINLLSFEIISYSCQGLASKTLYHICPILKSFHSARHGKIDQKDPSQSSLLLEDGPPTVATLLEMNLRKWSPFLAYLSACSTGQIEDERFFDESIHLISAYQLVGFRYVIGTLWEVNDGSCVDITRITYEVMRDGGMTDEPVCCEGFMKLLESFEAVGWISHQGIDICKDGLKRIVKYLWIIGKESGM